MIGPLGCPSFWQMNSSLKKESPKVREITIKVSLPNGLEAKLGAEIWQPPRNVDLVQPKTVVIFVPGSGFISRRGTQEGDGAIHYDVKADVQFLWADTLAIAGYYSFVYDKRNCSVVHDELCHENPVNDINLEGPVALARDVDEVCQEVQNQLGQDVRIVLWTSEQGTQVVLSSKCKDKAALLVFASPIPNRVDEFWINGLFHASSQPQNRSVKGQLIQKARNMQATFESIQKGLFAPEAKVMGVTLQFWKEWILLTKQTDKLFKSTKTPILFLIGEADGFYNAKSMQILERLAQSKERKLLILTGADRNLLFNASLNQTVGEIVLEALVKILNHD